MAKGGMMRLPEVLLLLIPGVCIAPDRMVRMQRYRRPFDLMNFVQCCSVNFAGVMQLQNCKPAVLCTVRSSRA
uniref:Putative secreted protein n=1 Tax=Anopheles darlingi TaxID=43151 RepID=A0A2M4DBT7_ANODA